MFSNISENTQSFEQHLIYILQMVWMGGGGGGV